MYKYEGTREKNSAGIQSRTGVVIKVRGEKSYENKFFTAGHDGIRSGRS